MPRPEDTITRYHYIEDVIPGKRLGRHVAHDSRSRGYRFRPAEVVPVVSKSWRRTVPITDQGDLGSCTGHAMVGALGTLPVEPAIPAGHPVLDAAEAVKLYSAATALDSFPGTYPPTDTGSDGLSVSKAAKAAGFLSGYTHALSLADTLQALMAGPVITGIDWYSSFDDPAPNTGLISITPGAQVRGGHEVLLRQVDAEAQVIGLDNSWGPGWGVNGSAWMSYATLGTLLADGGDVTVPVPVASPPPIPVPVPETPTVADRALWSDVWGWVHQNQSGTALQAAAAVRKWAVVKGLERT